MGRRYQPRYMPTNWSNERSSLGDTHVDAALAALNKACASEVNAMFKYTPTRMTTLHMLFDDDTTNKLKAVRGMVKPASNLMTYTVLPDVKLTVDFAEELIPTVQPDYLRPDMQRLLPLMTFINNIRPIYSKYEEVKAVLKWLNRNATAGAIRYYWPSAMKLCPQSPCWKDLQEVPSRFSEPANMGDWIQPLKDAATTVVGSLLLPVDAKPKDKGHMVLTFASTKVSLTDRSGYETDAMTFNL